MPGTRKLGRTTDSRNAMLRAMVTYLFENGKSRPPSPAPRKFVPWLRRWSPSVSRTICTQSVRSSYITKEDIAKKVIDEIGPKYADRNGGYTRIYKIGPRRGDAAEIHRWSD